MGCLLQPTSQTSCAMCRFGSSCGSVGSMCLVLALEVASTVSPRAGMCCMHCRGWTGCAHCTWHRAQAQGAYWTSPAHCIQHVLAQGLVVSVALVAGPGYAATRAGSNAACGDFGLWATCCFLSQPPVLPAVCVLHAGSGARSSAGGQPDYTTPRARFSLWSACLTPLF